MSVIPFSPEDTLGISAVASWLRPGVPEADAIAWVREKVRKRCTNQLPTRNVGKTLIFSQTEITAWINASERPVHAQRRRRKSAKKATT